jgi:hypothetical protein
MSLLMQLSAQNRPLYTWRATASLPPGNDGERRIFFAFDTFSQTKQIEKIAAHVVAGLTHDDTVQLVANEWEILPGVLRMRITQLANERLSNPSSNTQVKGITALDKKLGGKILVQAKGPTTRDLRVIDDVLVSRQRAIRPEVRGAAQAFAAYAKPKDFDSWSPKQRREWAKEMAARRRKDRS